MSDRMTPERVEQVIAAVAKEIREMAGDDRGLHRIFLSLTRPDGDRATYVNYVPEGEDEG